MSAENRVVLGLSDGVDSAVAAYILKRRGFEVFGLYMDISGPEGREAAVSSARQNGIPLKVLDVRERLMKYVGRPFAEEYLRGRTPNPCIVCNPLVKLPCLEEYADEIGARYIATGHYVKKDGGHLYMGAADNDQTYMFQRITQAQVERLLLPLGEKNKAEVRKLAEKLGLLNAKRRDSRDNCFLKGMNCAEWIETQIPDRVPPEGDAVFEGNVIGRHLGIHHWTVGQRWPEDIGGRRLYVSSINPVSNEITLCLWDELFVTEFDIDGILFIDGSKPETEFDASIRVKHTRRETPACHISLMDGIGHVKTESPVRAPVPGQPAALYEATRLLGGGFVC